MGIYSLTSLCFYHDNTIWFEIKEKSNPSEAANAGGWKETFVREFLFYQTINSAVILEGRTSSFSLPVESLTLHPCAMFSFQTSRSSIGLLSVLVAVPFCPNDQHVVLFGFSSLSVSSFVKKTTEKINTLQMNSELRQKPDSREGGQADNAAPPLEDVDYE